MRFRVLSAFLFLLFTTAWAALAHATSRRVLVVSGGASFEDALRVALSPWAVSVRRIEATSIAASMPSAVEAAEVLAHDYEAVGVVWIASDAAGHALWAYDAETRQVVTRAISNAPPFDAPTAAAAALTVKTLLRSSMVAPQEERIGAPASQPGPPPTPNPISPTMQPVAPNSVQNTPVHLAFELGAGPRFLHDGTDLRLIGAVAVSFAQTPVSLVLETRAGPGLGVTHPRFTGRFSDVMVPLWVRYRAPLGSRVALLPALGMGLDVSWLGGVAQGDAEGVSRVRADGLLNASVAVEVMALPQLRVSLEAMASYRMRYQRYLVDSEPVFTLRPLEASLSLRFSGGKP